MADTARTILEQLLDEPSRRWSSVRGEQTGLAYTLEVHADFSDLPPAVANVLRPRIVSGRTSIEALLEVLHAGGRRRIVHQGPGITGSSFVCFTDHSSGHLYLDPHNKTYVHIAPTQVPNSTYQPKCDFAIERRQRDADDEPDYSVRVTWVAHALRLRLWVSRDQELRRFASDVFELLFGPPHDIAALNPEWAELKRSIELITKGEVYFEPSASDVEPVRVLRVSQFQVKNIRLTQIGDDDFSLPHDYQDLRREDVRRQRSPDKPVSVQKGRFGDFRHGRRTVRRPEYRRVRELRGRVRNGSLPRHSAATLNQSSPRSDLDTTIPQCLPSTYQALFSAELRQALLDDVTFVVNEITQRLDHFSGSGGSITIDWLNQFRQTSQAMPNGDFLYCLLRDDSVPLTGHGGILDIFSQNRVELAVNSGDVTSIPVPAGVASEVHTVIADPAIPDSARFDSLSPTTQVALREAFLAQRVGSLSLAYTDNADSTSVFYDLIVLSFDSITFDIDFAHTAIIRSLEFSDNGTIALSLAIPHFTIHLRVLRRPSEFFVEISQFYPACLALPGSCWAFALLAAAPPSFWWDLIYVDAKFSQLTVDAVVGFEPDDDSPCLVPKVTALSTDESALDLSTVGIVPGGPIGVVGPSWNTLLYELVQAASSAVDKLMTNLESEAEKALTKVLRDDVGLRFPPALWLFKDLICAASQANSVARNHLYLEAALGIAGLAQVAPFVTQSDRNIYKPLRDVGLQLDGLVGTHYLGLTVSQNLTNTLLYVEWSEGQFDYMLGASEAVDLAQRIRNACPRRGIGANPSIRVWSAVPPRFVIAQRGFRDKGVYAEGIFDDVRICVSGTKGSNTLEFRFSAATSAQLGFFGLNAKSRRLDPAAIGQKLFDVYFDVSASESGPRIILPELEGITGVSDGTGGTLPGPDVLTGMDDVFLRAFTLLITPLRDDVIPRAATDPIAAQSYPIGNGQAGNVECRLDIGRGHIFARFGWSGVLAAAISGQDSTLDPGGDTCNAAARYRS